METVRPFFISFIACYFSYFDDGHYNSRAAVIACDWLGIKKAANVMSIVVMFVILISWLFPMGFALGLANYGFRLAANGLLTAI